MAKLTITEALAEIKTLGARIPKRRENVLTYLFRDAQLKDRLEPENTEVAYVAQERQAVRDLENRIVAIRCAIHESNLTTEIEVGGVTRSVQWWLNWKREVAKGQQAFFQTMRTHINAARADVVKRGMRFKEAGEGEEKKGDILVNVSEQALNAEIDQLEKTLGDLDGKLSLLNATTAIDVP